MSRELRSKLWITIVVAAAVIQANGIRLQSTAGLQSQHAAPDAGNVSQAGSHQHFWPHVRGRPGHYGTTTLNGPADIKTSLAWSWHHPQGRYHNVLHGGGIWDSEKNIYIASDDGIRKLSSSGQMLWHTPRAALISNSPSLMGNALFGNTQGGEVFALSLDTGNVLWSQKCGDSIGADAAYVEAYNGVVVTGMDSLGPIGGNKRVLGLNAETGAQLWEFKPEHPVWNVMAMFPDNSSTIFMDFTGGVYRLGLQDGKLIWHTPAPAGQQGSFLQRLGQSVSNKLIGALPLHEQSFSDGGVILGPDGSAYTCSSPVGNYGQEGDKGVLRKFQLSDGRILWETELPYPCLSWPAVSADDSSVVVVPGSFPDLPPTALMSLIPGAKMTGVPQLVHGMLVTLGDFQRAFARRLGGKAPDLHGTIMAFDTQTGHQQWRHDVTPYGGIASAGDEEGVLERSSMYFVYGAKANFCLPAHWSSPTITADGTVFVGRLNGVLYAYNPKTGERTYVTGTGGLHSGVTFAPGMMAYTDCDSLYVWNTD
eukprot:gnl/TRDRNA2_/TRDRNA2_176078_c0_seq30.p1 gnl/TRDRNA2_/TRDRNA2_176078_c0~~gnl/TRDRNA2_/TRDRNA2_176078_c0_seq30.p1  ORF type:complete len:536 (-),score=28.19 gnl/TRDRNA2_/TRDRNA2_176078_c0_seq30:56-1663(-)